MSKGTISFTSNGIAIGGNTANVTLDISAGNDAVAITVGNTAQRPIGQLGMFRYNPDINNFEGYILNGWSQLGNGVNALSNGVANSLFKSGYIQYTGAGQSFYASINLLFGTNIPNPSGTNAPCLLLGSNVPQVWLITDQQYTVTSPTVNVGMTAGEAQPTSLVPGGSFSIYGGAGANGTGGQVLIQGGTSLYGSGGDLTLGGGGSTNNVAGNVYVIGGQTGNQGGSVHLISTLLSGIPGYVYIKSNSEILYAFANTGAIYINGTKPGIAGQVFMSGGSTGFPTWNTGVTATITTAKLTTGGSNGSMTFVNGILTAYLAAT